MLCFTAATLDFRDLKMKDVERGAIVERGPTLAPEGLHLFKSCVSDAEELG